MPLKRKLINVGNSRAVIIPTSWLKYYEDKTGQKLNSIFMELNGIIKISVEDPEENNTKK